MKAKIYHFEAALKAKKAKTDAEIFAEEINKFITKWEREFLSKTSASADRPDHPRE